MLPNFPFRQYFLCKNITKELQIKKILQPDD